MINYGYSPQELKIIIDIANKHKIPISFYYDDEVSIVIHSKHDFKPLLKFSEHGYEILIDFNLNNLEYYNEAGGYIIKFMQEEVTIGL